MLSVFSDDSYIAYSPFLKPIMGGGVRCLAMDRELERRDPPAYAFLLQFARDNQLKMRPVRKARRPEDQATDAGVVEEGAKPHPENQGVRPRHYQPAFNRQAEN